MAVAAAIALLVFRFLLAIIRAIIIMSFTGRV